VVISKNNYGLEQLVTPKRKRRLYLIIMLLCGTAVVISLILYALRQNINLFFTPTQLLSQPTAKTTTVRIGGMVREGSVRRNIDADPLTVKFIVTDFETDITVQYTGVLPDLFREGQGVVASGKLDTEMIFKAVQILAKHDEKYMPPGSTNAA
jgi:cytochrome c-type biogenesis protein CcmE